MIQTIGALAQEERMTGLGSWRVRFALHCAHEQRLGVELCRAFGEIFLAERLVQLSSLLRAQDLRTRLCLVHGLCGRASTVLVQGGVGAGVVGYQCVCASASTKGIKPKNACYPLVAG